MLTLICSTAATLSLLRLVYSKYHRYATEMSRHDTDGSIHLPGFLQILLKYPRRTLGRRIRASRLLFEGRRATSQIIATVSTHYLL